MVVYFGEEVEKALKHYIEAVSYTHLDVYKRQIHKYKPERYL